MALSENEKMLKERIRFLLREKKVRISDISDNKTIEARLGRQINGEAQVPLSTIQMVLNMFPDIDANWLVMNEGTMRKADHLAPRVYNQHNEVHSNTAGGDINVGPDTIVTKKTVDTLQAIIDEQKKRIAELENDKTLLSGLLAQFTK